MTQETVSQRLKILIQSLGLNVRSFSQKYGVNESTTRGYVDRGSIPNADYIGALISSIESLNPAWLLLGQGEMFLNASEEVQVVAAGSAGQTDVEKEALRKEIDLLWTLIASRDALIEAKDVIIAAKDETLSLLREVRDRPN